MSMRGGIGASLDERGGNLIEEYLGGISQGIMDIAYVRAPALVTHDLVQLFLPKPVGPELGKIVLIIAKTSEFSTQFTGADVAIVIDHTEGLSGGTGHRPWGGLEVIGILDLVVQGKGSHVGRLCQSP